MSRPSVTERRNAFIENHLRKHTADWEPSSVLRDIRRVVVNCFNINSLDLCSRDRAALGSELVCGEYKFLLFPGPS